MVAEKHRIGWIGLGRTGYPMTEWLLKAGYTLNVIPDEAKRRSGIHCRLGWMSRRGVDWAPARRPG